MVKRPGNQIDAGSVTEVTNRILLWARRRVPVLLRVEFIDDLTRQHVVRNLKSELQKDNIPVHEINISASSSEDPALWLIDKFEQLTPGVVSIDGFSLVLPEKDPELQRTLYNLNLKREVLASFNLCQIWWMPAHIIDLFAGRIPVSAGETAVEPAYSQTLISQQFLHKAEDVNP